MINSKTLAAEQGIIKVKGVILDMVRIFTKIFVKFIVTFGNGQIEEKEDGIYLIWSDSGFMARPPMRHVLKIESR